MSKKSLAAILALVLAFSMLLTACGQPAAPAPGSSDPAPGSSDAPEAPVNTDPIIIGALTSLSGALQDYGDMSRKGFEIGLDYATNGTRVVAGRPIQVIWEDTTNVPDVARERAIKLLDQDKADILFGCASSGDAAAVISIAEEFKTIYMVEPAASDVLTGPSWNRYIFRPGRNTAQDALAIASVVTTETPGAKVATFAADNAFGHSAIDPLVAAVEQKGGTVIAQEFAPQDATDYTSYLLRIKEAKPDYLYVIWAGANSPWNQIAELDLAGAGITITAHAAEFAALKLMNSMVGLHGFTAYHHNLPDNPVNDYLVKEHMARYNSLPDLFTAGSTAGAIALVTALEKSNGDTDPEVLIPIMRGMSFESPTGTRYFREEDHQAMQPLFDIILEEGEEFPSMKLVRVIPAEEVAPAVTVPADAVR